MIYNFPEDTLDQMIRCDNNIQQISEERISQITQVIQRLLNNVGAHCEFKEITHTINATLFEIEIFNFNVGFEKIKRIEKTLIMHLNIQGIEILPSAIHPGVCISIPKINRGIVSFGYCYKNSDISYRSHPLEFALGVDMYNKPIKYNLAKLPHLLVAGSTGSGKSTCVHNIISSILCHAEPYSVQFVMVDPKQVELVRYEKLHKSFMFCEPVYNVYKSVSILYSMTTLIDNTFRLLRDADCSNIEEYNATHEVKLQYFVIIIDELAEVMLRAKKEVEPLIVKIAQLGRAAGVHMIAATQRPSHEIVTGLIKINFPASICFRVKSTVNSRIILDQSGGEKLLGQGDGLILDGTEITPKRFQAALTSREGTHKIIDTINSQFASG